MNKLYFGDNLEIMREMETGRVDLICTDPPFNSGRNYNAFFQESQAQNKAFEDIWKWGDEAQDTRTDIENPTHENCDLDTYGALDTCLKGYDMVLQNAVSGNKGSMRAYLAFMGPRLAEMHRLLKDDGSIYLHCDSAASHYLKGIMDAIWDQRNRKKNEFYRNEIVWSHQGTWIQPTKKYPRRHDTLLFYTKTDNYTFNLLYEDDAEQQVNYKRWQKYLDRNTIYGRNMPTQDSRFTTYLNKFIKEHGRKPNDDDPVLEITGSRIGTVQYIKAVDPKAPEDLGYDTQKPRVLYERIIQTSSNPGDLVLDPFCGCGTTIDAAHTHKRFWMGIDLTIIALDPMRERMYDRHNLLPHRDYEIDGYPTNMQEVRELVRNQKKYHDFSNWAVTRLGLKPTRDVGDGGKDGEGHVMLWNPDTDDKNPRRIYAEVKSGKPTLTEVRAFCRTMDKKNAIAGIFITIEPVTSGMRQEAADMGTFEHINNKNYPRLQFWQIDDAYFRDPDILEKIIRLPRQWIQPRKKSERHFAEEQVEFTVD